jgi:molecular chaperone GrpE
MLLQLNLKISIMTEENTTIPNKDEVEEQKASNQIDTESNLDKTPVDNEENISQQVEEELSVEEKLSQELETQKDKYLRLFAEFENYKRRTSKERIELFKTAGQEVMQAMLPVLDDFNRASKEVAKSKDKEVIQGVELIHNKLKDTLKAKGLEEFKVSVGDAFDADLHEAITQIPAPTEDMKGKIIDVIEVGYTLGEKIIRYPKVVTGK